MGNTLKLVCALLASSNSRNSHMFSSAIEFCTEGAHNIELQIAEFKRLRPLQSVQLFLKMMLILGNFMLRFWSNRVYCVKVILILFLLLILIFSHQMRLQVHTTDDDLT